jgi:hypothetical protein
MTASGDPAACIIPAMSGGPLDDCMSWEDFCECVLLESEDIAESIEDVRGGARPISTRCGGAVATMGGRVVCGEPPEDFEIRRESETLRRVAFESIEGREE